MIGLFYTAFYLRRNYTNKEGKSPVMARIYLNNERLFLCTTGVTTFPDKWDASKGEVKGRTVESLRGNERLRDIRFRLDRIYRKYADSPELSLELIKAEFLGLNGHDVRTVGELMDLYLENVKERVGLSLTVSTYSKYIMCKKHFQMFLKKVYNMNDMIFSRLTDTVVSRFESYLLRSVGMWQNSATKTMKCLKTIFTYGYKLGVIKSDPFEGFRFKHEPVDRGFLTDDELISLIGTEIQTPRLAVIRDIFIFSCFTGLAYVDVSRLKVSNVVTIDDKQWILTKRKKTNVESNVLLLDIPLAIVNKYLPEDKEQGLSDGKLFPVPSAQKVNAYLKEIAVLCDIEKNLTFHLARHTFATLSLSKGVPMESVSKMLGHKNIKTTQIYARIIDKKIEEDMSNLAGKLNKFNEAIGI